MNLSSYLLSISLLILFISLISILLPNGKLNKFIKVIFSILIVLCMLKPIISLTGGELNFTTENDDYLSLNQSFIDSIENKRIEKIIDEVKNKANTYNLGSVQCDLDYTYNSGKIYINKIKIKLNESFNVDKEHSNILEDFICDVANLLNIDKSLVIIDG